MIEKVHDEVDDEILVEDLCRAIEIKLVSGIALPHRLLIGLRARGSADEERLCLKALRQRYGLNLSREFLCILPRSLPNDNQNTLLIPFAHSDSLRFIPDITFFPKASRILLL